MPAVQQDDLLSPGTVPSYSATRRSARVWQPSRQALENIVDEVTCLEENVEAVFTTADEVTSTLSNGLGVDYAFATQKTGVPRTYTQILALPQTEKSKWLAACRAESDSHLAIPSIGRRLSPAHYTKAAPIRLSWVFVVKPTGDYKARIVMMGQHMKEGIHFNDTHAPVPSPTIVRLFFAITARGGRDFTQLDVKTAFLTAPLDIELDVLLPQGFGRGGDEHEYTSDSRRRRALTAIPGCPQGTRVWREKLARDLQALGFGVLCPSEPCFFKDDNPDPIYLIVWVDDVFLSAPSTPCGRARKERFVTGMKQLYPHGVKSLRTRQFFSTVLV